jgi:hypothetical protein
VEFFAQRLEPVDISLGGLRIYSDQEYRVGELLRLDIFFPRDLLVTFTAEVMWTKILGKGAPARFDLGLAFVELSPEALNVLLSALGSEREVDSSPESRVEPAREPVHSAIEFASNEPSSEVVPVTSGPATVRMGRGARSMLSSIPVVSADKLHSAQLDRRAASLVSLIDGLTTVEGLLDLRAMSPDETLSLLEDLRQRGIIELR